MTLPEPSRTSPLVQRGPGITAAVVVVALLVGVLLGGVPWRYRKQLWQLQGAAAGLAAGFLLGRWSGKEREQRRPDQPPMQKPHK